MNWIKPPWEDPANEPTEDRPEGVWPFVGDPFLAAVQTRDSLTDKLHWLYAVVEIQEGGTLLVDEMPWDFGMDDVEWIARITKPEAQ